MDLGKFSTSIGILGMGYWDIRGNSAQALEYWDWDIGIWGNSAQALEYWDWDIGIMEI